MRRQEHRCRWIGAQHTAWHRQVPQCEGGDVQRLLIMGVTACLAYMHIDLERYAVERGYKSIHNPSKGQELAQDLILHGDRVGDSFECRTPQSTRRLKVIGVIFQPEAALAPTV